MTNGTVVDIHRLALFRLWVRVDPDGQRATEEDGFASDVVACCAARDNAPDIPIARMLAQMRAPTAVFCNRNSKSVATGSDRETSQQFDVYRRSNVGQPRRVP
jgi:hypothetical protein